MAFQDRWSLIAVVSQDRFYRCNSNRLCLCCLPNSIREADDQNVFKKPLKTHLFDHSLFHLECVQRH